MNPYEEITRKLIEGGFFPALQKRENGKSRVLECLLIDSPPILRDEREKRIKEITGDGFRVDWMPNESHFIIKKK